MLRSRISNLSEGLRLINITSTLLVLAVYTYLIYIDNYNYSTDYNISSSSIISHVKMMKNKLGKFGRFETELLTPLIEFSTIRHLHL